MDEAELEALFRRAATGAPEPSFDADDVRRGSRRVTARRRTALAGGSLAAAAVLAGGVGFGTGAFEPAGGPVAQAPAPAAEPAPDQRPMSLPQQPMSPRAGTFSGGEVCGPPDADVARALVQELPEAAHTTPIGANAPCPAGARTAAVALREGAANGRFAVLISPAGSGNAAERRPAGTAVAQLPARSGNVITVLSEPTGSGAAPYADRVHAVAERLATRF